MRDVAVILDAVEPVVAALGLELYDVEVAGTGRALVVRVLVDREGGIDLDTVGSAAEAISPVLDRAVGDTISVKTPGRRIRGVVVEAGDDSFELALEDGTHERISYADVAQARTVFEWGAKKVARK